jgi:hypothetical protein
MPTGYTADLYDGNDVSFREFVLRCARAMSPFIMQRDNDPNELPKKVDDSYSYYRKRLPEAIAERDEFVALDRASRKRLWTEYVERISVENKRSLERAAEIRSRYEGMLAKVMAWDVDPVLDNFKQFMIEQLTSSIDFDCKPYTSTPMTFEEWESHTLDRNARDVDYYVEEVRKEDERVAFQHEYTDKLYAALYEADASLANQA